MFLSIGTRTKGQIEDGTKTKYRVTIEIVNVTFWCDFEKKKALWHMGVIIICVIQLV